MDDSTFSSEVFTSFRVGRFGDPLIAVASTNSTNLDALDRADNHAVEGTIVVADHQRAGRGRWGREWIGVPGASLMFSLVLRPEGDPTLITTALGVATAEAIEALCDLTCQIKWPNDVLIDSRKVAGILVESRSGAGRVQALVAGLGINVGLTENDLPEELRSTATSLQIELAKRGENFPPGREQVLAAILTRLEARYPVDPQKVVSEAAARSSILGTEVIATHSDDTTTTGTATRLLEDGALELSTPTGTVTITSGDITALRTEAD